MKGSLKITYEPSVECEVDENIIFSFCRLMFCSIDSVICFKEAFSVMRSKLLLVDLRAFAISILLRKLSPKPMC